MSAPDVAPQHDESQSTTFCPFCNLHLQFPTGSSLIQCPSCNNTLDPNVPHQIRCSGCSCLLAYPPNALYIQCPRCNHTMDPRHPDAPAPPPNKHAGQTTMKPEDGAGVEPKKRRDPNMPKAVTNAYMIFCKRRRNELKEKHPELPFGKIGAKLGEIWRNMSVEEKQPYEDLAAQDRERYRREMQDYQSAKNGGGGGAGGAGGSKRQKTGASSSASASAAAQQHAAADEEGDEDEGDAAPRNKQRKGGVKEEEADEGEDDYPSGEEDDE